MKVYRERNQQSMACRATWRRRRQEQEGPAAGRVYTKACFSSSLRTSSWLLSLATSMGVFPSRFCSVLHEQSNQPAGVISLLASFQVSRQIGGAGGRLTRRRRSRAGARRSPCGRIRRRSAARCSCSCRRRPPRRRPPGAPARTGARRSRTRSGGHAALPNPPRPYPRRPPALSSGPACSSNDHGGACHGVSTMHVVTLTS